jgi:hypothetical protein
MSWLKNLSEEKREEIFSWMRERGEEAAGFGQRARERMPRAGEIAAGAAFFDPWLKGEVIHEFLSALRRGSNPFEAKATVKVFARMAVNKHNAKSKDVNWKRWEGTADDDIERLFAGLMKLFPEGRDAKPACGECGVDGCPDCDPNQRRELTPPYKK